MIRIQSLIRGYLARKQLNQAHNLEQPRVHPSSNSRQIKLMHNNLDKGSFVGAIVLA